MSSHVRLTLGTRSWEEGGERGGGEWMIGNETNEMFSNTGAQRCPCVTSCITIKTRA